MLTKMSIDVARPEQPFATGATGATTLAMTRRDIRRWIYGGLDLAFAAFYALVLWKLIPARMPSAQLHLWSFPLIAVVMAIGTLLGNARGWWIAVISGSLMLLSAFALIARLVMSAAFLAGVYGAFGRSAATVSLLVIAIVLELVALLPIVQVKYLMTRAGRRAHGILAT